MIHTPYSGWYDKNTTLDSTIPCIANRALNQCYASHVRTGWKGGGTGAHPPVMAIAPPNRHSQYCTCLTDPWFTEMLYLLWQLKVCTKNSLGYDTAFQSIQITNAKTTEPLGYFFSVNLIIQMFIYTYSKKALNCFVLTFSLIFSWMCHHITTHSSTHRVNRLRTLHWPKTTEKEKQKQQYRQELKHALTQKSSRNSLARTKCNKKNKKMI